MRFQDEHFCEHDSISRNKNVRKIPQEDPYHDYQVGGTKLCADYAKRSTEEWVGAIKKCKYSNNYPVTTRTHANRLKCSSIYV